MMISITLPNSEFLMVFSTLMAGTNSSWFVNSQPVCLLPYRSTGAEGDFNSMSLKSFFSGFSKINICFYIILSVQFI